MKSNDLYHISSWGEGYFQINKKGNIEISGVELQSIVQKAHRVGLRLPLLIRFADILHDRVKQIYNAFAKAIADINYGGTYQLVYPIKVNQEHCVVRELLSAPSHKIGFESGSKPELMAILGLLTHKPTTIICNGYKDNSYIRMALIAQLMGHQVFIVIEKLSELAVILYEAKKFNIKPVLGVRVRLVATGRGKWEHTGGNKSKFGLHAAQILDLLEQLKANNWLDTLQFMHCHLGSQIANIHDIRNCMQEVARYYVELKRLNAPIHTIDVGGGLGIDYEGTKSNNDCSLNYTLEEYATHILLAIYDVCREKQIKEPNIISESGRALTAHHAVLITNIIDIESASGNNNIPIIKSDESRVVRELRDTLENMAHASASETYNHALHALTEAHTMFQQGILTLVEKAKVEKLYNLICLDLLKKLNNNIPLEHNLIQLITEQTATKVFCNLSFFQSLPDAWAIGQIFPVLPISNLEKTPNMHAILKDLTCDSDGTIKQYTGSGQIEKTLLLPDFSWEKPYCIAFFLVGAYQEILGNIHNLFGDTNSLEVKLLANGQFDIQDIVHGDTVTTVLNYAHFETKKLLSSYEKQLAQSDLTDKQVRAYLNELRLGFGELTYLTRHPTTGEDNE